MEKWIDGLPWWVKWAFSAGVGFVTICAAALTQLMLVAGLITGFAFIAVAAFGLLFHYYRKMDPTVAVEVSKVASPTDVRIPKQIEFDAETLRLAGLVRAIAEVAGSPSFRLPVSENSAFIRNYRALEDSTHAVWVDADINQMRRDFLHACGAVGDSRRYGEIKESLEWTFELVTARDNLLKALSGTA
jgi:hypothetical protein